MSECHLPKGQLEECPYCITLFYAFFVAAHAPGRQRNPVVQEHVSKIMAFAARRGFTHNDILATMVANGQDLSEQALWLATRLGEFVGVDRMQAMVRDLVAELKSQQINPPGEPA